MAQVRVRSEDSDVRNGKVTFCDSSPTQASFSRWAEETDGNHFESSTLASPQPSAVRTSSPKRMEKQKLGIDTSSFKIDSFAPSTSSAVCDKMLEEMELGLGSPLLRLASAESRDDSETISTPRLLTPYGSTKWEDEAEAPIIQQLESEWYERVNRRMSEARREQRSAPCTIFKVHKSLHNCQLLRTALDPNIVSVGPYHRHVPRLRAMEDIKSLCLRDLLQRFPDQVPAVALEGCLVEMKTLEARARSCYSEPIEMESNDFAEMMLLDGCFIIYTLLMVADRKEVMPSLHRDLSFRLQDTSSIEGREEPAAPAPEMNHLRGREREGEESAIFTILRFWNLIRCDIIMLDNQIPFFIIHALWQLLKPLKIPPEKLAVNLFRDLHPFQNINFSPAEDGTIYHLLDLVHCTVVSSFPVKPSLRQKEPEKIQEWIPSAKELKDVGIRCRRKIKFRGFSDITFNNGFIEIPPLHIHGYTIVLFQNLIHFEQCFPNGNQFISVYLKFMDSIIRGAEDVRLLQLKGIIVNRLSSDEEVARFFNGLSAQIHHIPEMHYLQSLYNEVQSHRVSRSQKWKADLIRKHFNSPWKLISLIAASFLLILTAMQTYYAAYTFYRTT